MSEHLLTVQGLDVRIDSARGTVRAVDGVSVAVGAGEIVGIVGESGSGKSTLLRAIMGLLPQTARVVGGTLAFDGRSMSFSDRGALKRLRGDVSMIFQEPMMALNPIMPVGEQIAEAPRRRLGLSRRAARLRALELMRDVGIPASDRRYRAYAHELSGGLQQRVLIAAALSAEPRVLLCDEPTTALDVTVQRQILNLLADLRDRRQLGILYVTHDLAAVAQLCDRVEVMYAGQIIETGRARAVFEMPLHAYTLGLLEALPDYRGARRRLVSIPGSPPSPVEPPAGCRFHPRCSFATRECREGTVTLHAAGHGHATTCLHSSEVGSAPRLRDRDQLGT